MGFEAGFRGPFFMRGRVIVSGIKRLDDMVSNLGILLSEAVNIN
jgi:hypothetical protein